jgi:hypothetical protein
MKLSKNTLIAASMTIAIALGCANFMDTTLSTPQASATTAHSELAKADLDATLFNVGGVKPDVIIVKPD